MLRIDNLVKSFAGEKARGKKKDEAGHSTVFAVNDVSFEVKEGELFTLLGPSGCGKTTTLRSIAGLERPDSGTIAVGEKVMFSAGPNGSKGKVVNLPANQRGLGMVFQSYAIWPHMTVFDNVAFPLQVRKRAERPGKKEISERVTRVLETMELSEQAGRQATKLSGGQQQRLALARALVIQPPLLLLDEPLSNLDAKLRDAMRTELKRLQREFNLTTIYVTHDQSEALSLSHEIAVMNEGSVVQIGTPRQIYETPKNQFVADFVGSTNFIGGTVTSVEGGSGRCVVSSALGNIKAQASEGVAKDNTVIVSVRPEDVELSEQEPQAAEADNIIRATVHAKDFLGEYLDFQVKVGDVVLQSRAHPSLRTPTGDLIYVRMRSEKCVAIPSAAPRSTASAA